MPAYFFPPLFPSPARNRRHQRDLIAFGEFVILIQKTDVLIIHVDIQKPPHLALFIAQMRLQLREAVCQPVQQFI